MDGALGTWNINTHAKDSHDLLRVIADTMTFPGSSDYIHGGEPWLILSPEHAQIFHRDGLNKLEVKRRLKYLKRGEVQMVLPNGASPSAPAPAPPPAKE